MIDAPGPWGTGPFTLVEGHSRLTDERVSISEEPFAATWLWRQDRTPRVRLVANKPYWDTKRGPHLEEVVFRNDLSPEQALELVCTTEGEVDIVTEVAPADAERVERSEHATLVAIDAIRSVVGIIDRDADGLPLADKRARQALNLAVDRDALIQQAMCGRAQPLAGLTPRAALTKLDLAMNRLSPYPHDPARAAELWRAAGGRADRPIRVAAMAKLEPVARRAAADLSAALAFETEVIVYRGDEQEREARRRLATKTRPREWDILLYEQGSQAADAPPFELHRAFVGTTGEWRVGPVIPEFEALWAELVSHTAKPQLARVSDRIDRFVYDEALALFLCAPQALYAVNKHVDFTPYRTTFELAECRVSERHWSCRPRPAPV